VYAQKINSAGIVQWVAGGLPICRAAGSQSGVRVLFDGSGGAYLVWTDGRSGTSRIYGQRVDANGTPLWGVDGTLLADYGGQHGGPAMIGFAANGGIVCWTDGLGAESDIRAQRFDAAGNRLWGPAGVYVCTAPRTQYGDVLVGGTGFGAVFAWRDLRAGNWDAYALRLSASAGGAVDVEPVKTRTLAFAVASANPSRGAVSTWLELPRQASVDVDVVDLAGRCVRTLRRTESLAPGKHAIHWDGADAAGDRVCTGLYWIRARVGHDVRAVKVTVLQ
jgi:hypothetical protein